MKLITCCCSWSYVVGRRNAYGPIYPQGIGDYPDALAPSQRMMTRAELADQYADCAACINGGHQHQDPPPEPSTAATSGLGQIFPPPGAAGAGIGLRVLVGPGGAGTVSPDREGRPEPPPA